MILKLCTNFLSCCMQLKLICCVFFLVSTTTHCLIQLQHTRKEQFGFTNQNLNLPTQLFVSIQHSKLSWRRQLVTTPSFMKPDIFLPLLQHSPLLLSLRWHSRVRNVFLFVSSERRNTERGGRRLHIRQPMSRIYAFPGRRPSAPHTFTHIQHTLRGNLMRLPPGRARPVYEYW